MNNKIKRIIAATMDLVIVILLIYVWTITNNGFSKLTNVPVDSGAFFGIFYSYFILLDFFLKGTLGKRMMKIKVNVSKRNFLIFFRIVIRNLFNILELIIPLIYIIPVLIWNKKLGGYLSKVELEYE